MIKKISFLLLIPILFTAVGCSPTDKISFRSDDFVFDTYYSDSYFRLDNKEVHEEIALASHAMALSTFRGGKDYSNHSEYLKDLWKKEGFKNISINNDFFIKPNTDTIGFGMAEKTVDDFTLIAIAVRGGNYDGEWASNFTIGEVGNATGFDEASDKVVAGLDEYVGEYKITGHVKIWISGYSRAAITSNMTAGKLLNRLANNETKDQSYYYTADDIYAYCFEPPMGVAISLNDARDELYHGIHNFLNYNDLVPLVAPYEWGFVRYGTDHYYPDRLTDIYFDASEREKILSLYHFTNGAEKFAEYSVDKWKFFDIGEKKCAENNLPRNSIHPSQGRFLRTLIHEVATRGFETREIYYNSIQDGLRNLFAAIFGINPKIPEIDFSSIVDIIFEYDIIKTLFLELENGDSAEFALDIQMLFLQIFGADDNSFDAIRTLYQSNINLFYLFADSFTVRKDILSQLLYRDNALGIAIGHMPEVSYTFLSSCDSRFYGDNKCKFNDGSYYTLHLDKPISFTLLEKNLKKAVFEFRDGEMISDILSAEQYADGSIDIYLPKNGAYEYISNVSGISLTNVDPVAGESIIEKSFALDKGTI